ncbi:AEC family transporter [Clostridium chromiireducens]|uniref:AEC family transporter n=1 Tax=Clostridium chromiireducens TaxID=225345 RepID=A0A1V4III3_9CLOT|nr:AEC family transporter [Clostridium chromiireducens]OPJ59307.1 membrane transport protein [Clostridium chromiireducens]RII33406.1 AEC family transporter [Clostridium chromiireducens]
MIIFNALGSVFSIVLMISTGFFLSHKGWFDEKTSQLFSKLVCNLAIPCLMISQFTESFDKDKLLNLGGGLFAPFTSMALGYLIAVLVSKLVKVNKGRIGTFRSMFFVSNSIFIGLPVNMALFGEKSIPNVLLYYIANTTFFWTIGVYEISRDGQSGKANILSLDTVKRIMSPPLLSFVFAIILVLSNVHLPKFILDTCKYFGNLTTPLAMLFIGITIYSVNLKEFKLSLDMAAIILGRFLISPLLILVLCNIINIPLLMKEVFVIQAAMPVMTNTAIVSKRYGADYEYATISTIITTILSLLAIPIYMILLS